MTGSGSSESLAEGGVHLIFRVNFSAPFNVPATFIGKKDQVSTFQARIPHSSFSAGDMVRWYGQVSLGFHTYMI